MEEELQLLTKCPINEVPKLLHFIVDQMFGHKPVVGFSEFQKIWTLQEWWQINKTYTNAIKNAVKNQSTKADMKMFQCLPTDYLKTIQDCLTSRREEIVQLLLNETCSISGSSLKDFDWQLKLVVGSDKMANLKIPVASVMLQTSSEQNVALEMNKEELAKFIATLEQANRAVSQLQA